MGIDLGANNLMWLVNNEIWCMHDIQKQIELLMI